MEQAASGLPRPLSKSARLDDPYVVAGDRAYLIGRQDGMFPPLGDHVPGEMGGLWAHPHKLLDGFWCAIVPIPSGDGAGSAGEVHDPWLPPATRIEVADWGVTQYFDLPDVGVRLSRGMVVPDGLPALLIDLEVTDTAGRAHDMEIAFVCRSKLRPGWLDPRPDGTDTASASDDGATIVATDPTGPWSVAWGSRETPASWRIGEDVHGPEPFRGEGIAAAQRFRLSVPPGGQTHLRLGVCGVAGDERDAARGLRDLLDHAGALVLAKQQRLVVAASVSHLDVPEPALLRAWEWARCAYDWLVRDVPGVGRGLGAGLPEFPWWFACDSAYALRGLLPLGDFQTAAQTLRLLARVSRQTNGDSGRIAHEIACTGRVFNPGNTQETPQFARAVLETYLWSGDRALVDDLYPLCRDGVLAWTLGQCDADGDLLPEGYGITEVHGLDGEMIDSAVWAHEGLRALGRMAALVGDVDTAARCAELAPRLRDEIERRFWQAEEGLYADWIATPRAAIPVLERLRADAQQRHNAALGAGESPADHLAALLRRAALLPPHEEAAWYLGNWIINAPLEAGLSAPQRASAVLDRLDGPDFCGPDGVYLSAIERSSAMSIATGALAAAACAYGRVEQALRLCRLLASQLMLRMPGAISEYSPDGGCFVQAWSGYGIAYPLVAGVFGLFPDAAARHLVIAPSLPDGWPCASLRRVRIGTALLDVELSRPANGEDGTIACRLCIDQPGWHVTILPRALRSSPLTPLTVHSSLDGGQWGMAPELAAAARTVELPAGTAVDVRL